MPATSCTSAPPADLRPAAPVLPQTARVRKGLSDGEEVVLRLRPHGRALVRPALVLVLVMGVGGFAAAALPAGDWQLPGRVAVAVVGAALLLRLSVLPWLRWLTSTLLVTDRRVQLRSGVLRTTTRDVPLGRIADVGVERSLGQRVLGAGTLVLDTTGERGLVVVRDVPRVQEVARTLTDLLDELHDDGELAPSRG